jgi:hypothetical protein
MGYLHNTNKIELGHTVNLPQFIFEDVKFLGTSDTIDFDRNSAETQDFTFSFIYRRMKPIYMLENTYDSTSWVQKDNKKTSPLQHKTFFESENQLSRFNK